MNIVCPISHCRTINPANAKFCRKCGTPLTHLTPTNRFKQMFHSTIAKIFATNYTAGASTFTLDTFSNIIFQPVSIVKIRFVNRFVVFLCLLFILFFIAIIEGLFSNLYDKTGGDFFGVIDYYEIESAWLCLGIVTFCLLFIAKGVIKKLKYKLNADYIETSFVNNEIVRIARKSQMGLFDKSKNKVLLSSIYSNIEKFDNQHLLISKGNKKGLYSLTYRRIIIPVMYDSISQFVNSVTSATTQGTEHHYDVKGNKLM